MVKVVARKRVTMVTPPGVFVWPKLNEPDYGTKEYPKPNGEYSVKLHLNKKDEAVKRFIAKLTEYHSAAVENAKAKFDALKVTSRKELERRNGPGGIAINPLYKPIYDDDTEEATDTIEFKFSMLASGKREANGRERIWTQKPVIVDATGRVLKNPPMIWSGTTGLVSINFEPDGYFIPGTGACGLSLKLAGVQILELVSSNGRDAKSLGFGRVEGYEGIEESSEGSSVENEEDEEGSNGAPGDEDEDF